MVKEKKRNQKIKEAFFEHTNQTEEYSAGLRYGNIRLFTSLKPFPSSEPANHRKNGGKRWSNDDTGTS